MGFPQWMNAGGSKESTRYGSQKLTEFPGLGGNRGLGIWGRSGGNWESGEPEWGNPQMRELHGGGGQDLGCQGEGFGVSGGVWGLEGFLGTPAHLCASGPRKGP